MTVPLRVVFLSATSIVALANGSLVQRQQAVGAVGTENDAHPGGQQKKRLGLLRKKWDWQEAYDESKTEWGIVLKRFYMVDMILSDLERQFAPALPEDPTTKAPQERDEAVLAKLRTKLQKLASNLEAADADQQTDDTTFGQMETDAKLRETQKQALRDQHNQEVSGAFALNDLGRTASQDAASLLRSVEQQAPPSPSAAAAAKAANASRNAAKGGAKAADANAAPMQLYAKFQESAAGFHKGIAKFEKTETATVAKLLSYFATMRRRKVWP